MVQKSKNKDAIREIYPGVIKEIVCSSSNSNTVFSIEDGLIQLRGFRGTRDVNPTGKDVIKHVLSNAIETLNGSSCQCYVFILDKPSWIPKIKGIEHKKREKNSKKVNICPDPEEGYDIFPINNSLPYEWDAMMANRKTRRELIDCIISNAKNYFHTPQGKNMIFDGGSSSEEHRPTLTYSEIDVNKKENMFKSVINIDQMYDKISERTISRPSIFENRIGECDINVLFYVEYFRNDRKNFRIKNSLDAKDDSISIEVITQDTDFIPILLCYYRFLDEEEIDIILKFKMKQSLRTELGGKNESLSIRDLYKNIENDIGMYNRFPSMDLSIVMIITGNDYLIGFRSITPFTALKTLIENVKYIGELVIEENGEHHIPLDSFLRLIKSFYCKKFEKQLIKFFQYILKKRFNMCKKIVPTTKKSKKEESENKDIRRKNNAKILEWSQEEKDHMHIINNFLERNDGFYEKKFQFKKKNVQKKTVQKKNKKKEIISDPDIDLEDINPEFVKNVESKTQNTKGLGKRKKIEQVVIDENEVHDNDEISEVIETYDNEKKMDLPVSWWSTIPWSLLCFIIRSKNANEKVHIPKKRLMWLKYKRLYLNFLYITQQYKHQISYIDELCLKYGYSLINPEENISMRNIRETLPEDDFEIPENDLHIMQDIP